MRRVLKVVEILCFAVLACAVGLWVWLYFYTSDLPPVSQLGSFKGVSKAEAQIQSCNGPEQTIAVVPREKLGRYTVPSLIAAEGMPDARSPFVALFIPAEGHHKVPYQLQLARSLMCPSRSLNRQFQELRLANAINRTFDEEDVLTIYLNRVYLGPNVYGIEAAAKRYLGKNPSDMTLEESAAMVAMTPSPRVYSPLLHPDRATQRRSSILDEMVVEGTISQSDADRAKTVQIHFLE